MTLGRIGEDLAWDHLKKMGYHLIERNYREKFGEIDIIVRSPQNIMVFVEVKTMRSHDPEMGLMAEDNFTKAKKKKFIRICEMFVAKHQELLSACAGWRMDLVTINVDGDKKTLQHYTDI